MAKKIAAPPNAAAPIAPQNQGDLKNGVGELFPSPSARSSACVRDAAGIPDVASGGPGIVRDALDEGGAPNARASDATAPLHVTDAVAAAPPSLARASPAIAGDALDAGSGA